MSEGLAQSSAECSADHIGHEETRDCDLVDIPTNVYGDWIRRNTMSFVSLVGNIIFKLHVLKFDFDLDLLFFERHFQFCFIFDCKRCCRICTINLDLQISGFIQHWHPTLGQDEYTD